jgi:hypothetical protein
VDYLYSGERAEFLLIAVADGAGSASLSHLGSKAACEAAILALKQRGDILGDVHLAPECIKQCFDAAFCNVRDIALGERVPLGELATTLQIAAIGHEHSVFGQVGDGAIVWGDPGELRLVHWPEQEALNLTDFITSAPLSETLNIAVEQSSIRRVACMTDGLSPLLLDFRTRSPHAPAIERLFRACAAAPDSSDLSQDLEVFLHSTQVTNRTDDDTTLILAIRDEENGP